MLFEGRIEITTNMLILYLTSTVGFDTFFVSATLRSELLNQRG
jgi:hypothetical protein